MPFLKPFENHLQTQRLLKKKDRFLVAVSGGPDSTALLHLLAQLRQRWQWDLAVVHVNHQMRGRRSLADENFVRRLAAGYRIPFHCRKMKITNTLRSQQASVEEAARKVRYQAFDAVCRKTGFKKIVTAHTQDDQAETVLMRILQGTGLKGLSGIRTQMKINGIIFFRPLLPFRKTQLLDYLKERKLPYRIDESNRSTRFLRNRIRHLLFPTLKKEFNPRIVETLARIPLIVEEETQLFGELETAAWKKAFRSRTSKKLTLNRPSLGRFPKPLQFRLLDKALKAVDPRSGLSFEAWHRLYPQLRRPRFRCSLPRDLDLILSPLTVEIYKKKLPR